MGERQEGAVVRPSPLVISVQLHGKKVALRERECGIYIDTEFTPMKRNIAVRVYSAAPVVRSGSEAVRSVLP